MIYTLTLSPSLDYINKVSNFEVNKINRSNDSFYLPGGKGINVSIVLKELGIESIALGFVSGFTGKFLIELLNEKNIRSSFIEATGTTRVNVKIQSNLETAINTNTLIINQDNLQQLKNIINKLEENDILIISGSVPNGVNENIYEDLIKDLDPNVKVIMDTTSSYLLKTLKYKPFLVKPNREELEELFNKEINGITEIKKYANELRNLGAKNVIVSLDKEGALLCDSNGNDIYLKSYPGNLVSSVGAGDSLVAGFVCGIKKGQDIKEAFMLGVACGNATAYSDSLATKEEIDQMLIKVKEINHENN